MNNIAFDELSTRGKVAVRWSTVLTSIALAGVVVFALVKLKNQGFLSSAVWGQLLTKDVQLAMFNGLMSTFKVALTTMLLSLVVGLVLAIARMSHRATLRGISRVWTEVFRGLPELLLIFFIFLGFPHLGIQVSTFWALCIGLVLYESALVAEVFRAGFAAQPFGQAEAGLSLGLSNMKVMRYIRIPQVIPQILPSLINEMVRVTKASSLGFTIGYAELLHRGKTGVEYLGEIYSLPIFTLVAVIYVAVGLLLSWLAKRVNALVN